jgi:hypothetical protein
MHSFVSIFERWLDAGEHEKPDIKLALQSLCRSAWASNDEDARFLVLNFIVQTRYAECYDLIREAMLLEDINLAETGATSLLSLAAYGIRLGSESDDALLEYMNRLPASHNFPEALAKIFELHGWRLPG